MSDTLVRKAISVAGSQVALADAINRWHLRHDTKHTCSQQNISKWLKRGPGLVVPAEHCPAIEVATNEAVKRSDLRPDLWPPEPEATQQAM